MGVGTTAGLRLTVEDLSAEFFRSLLGKEVGEAGEEHVFVALGADTRGNRSGLAHGIAQLEPLTRAAAVALVDVVPVTGRRLPRVSRLRAAGCAGLVAGGAADIAGIG
jgi:hypothetical protein